jgi:DNA-binding HxlR family transcriptional regulator
MKRAEDKSRCPVNFALESFGDAWSLLVVRDIVFFGKKTYGEFLCSAEGISTNILANRLASLERKGILVRRPDPSDRRRESYELTEKGLDLIPMLMEMCAWSARHDRRTAAPPGFVKALIADRDRVLRLIREVARGGGSVFNGRGSVIERLRASPPPSPPRPRT